MNHKQKLTLARKLMTPEELKKKHFGPFDSEAWNARRDTIQTRVRDEIQNQQYAAQMRKKRLQEQAI